MGTVEHLKTLCCLGLPPESAMIAVTPLLHEIIPHSWMRIGPIGEGLALRDGWAENPETPTIFRERLPEILKQPGLGQLLAPAIQAVGIGWSLHAQGRGWTTSARYREIEAPLDSCWLLDAMIGENGRSYASLVLTRPRGAPRFVNEDVKRLDLLRPWLAHSLRPLPSHRMQGNRDRPAIAALPVLSGLLIVTADGEVVHQTRTSEHLFITIEGGVKSRSALPGSIMHLIRRIAGPPTEPQASLPSCGFPTLTVSIGSKRNG